MHKVTNIARVFFFFYPLIRISDIISRRGIFYYRFNINKTKPISERFKIEIIDRYISKTQKSVLVYSIFQILKTIFGFTFFLVLFKFSSYIMKTILKLSVID